MNPTEEKQLKRGRFMYVLQAAFEYLISILVTGSFLATLTKELGFSDSLTGVLSSVTSLGCLFQLCSLAINRKRSKSLVIALSLINQLLFVVLYVLPVFNGGSKIKPAIFAIVIIAAYLCYNIAHPKKINWLMSLVEDAHRGTFTANKEIVSLISGMVFSFAMGTVVDHFVDLGKTKTAFILSAAVIFALMILHTLSLLLAPEKNADPIKQKNIKNNLVTVFCNKDILKVTAVYAFYYMSHFAAVPFYGTYQINELGFSLKFVSVLSISAAIARISISKFWGKYADKNSFAAMIEKCFLVLMLSFVCVVFSGPSNGKIMLILYNVFHGIAMGGINSAMINMIFDYAPHENRADALAISQAVSGFIGFLTTLAVSPLVSAIQSSRCSIFGITIYAQQIVTAISLVIIAVAIVYVRKMFKPVNKGI